MKNIPQLKLQQLRYFKDICSTHNYTRTAENFFTSQSNISYAIRSLEKTLGVVLFEKSASDIIPTQFGNTFLPYVDTLFKALEEGCQAIEDMKSDHRGKVSIGYSFVFTLDTVPMLFKYLYDEFNNSNMDIELISKMAHINEDITCVDDMLINGMCDLSITCSRVRDGIEECQIDEQELVLLLPYNHPLADRKTLRLEDVKDEPFILLEGDSVIGYYTHMFEVCGITPNVLNPGLDWLQILLQVSAGKCLTIAPRHDYSSYDIVAVELDHPQKYRNVYLTWAKNRKLSNAAKYTRDLIISYFNG